MSISFEKSDEIGNQSILENAFDIHFYWECKHCINFFYRKWLYVQNKNDNCWWIKTIPSIIAGEIFNFINIYLRYHPSEGYDYFFKEKEIWIMNTDFVGPYLKQEGDPEYFLINECNDSGLHFLWSFLARFFFELAIDLFYLSQYRKLDGFFDQKSEYIFYRDEFIRKFRIKYPQMSDVEIFNFMSIYLIMSRLKIIMRKVIFYSMVEFQLIDFVGLVLICKKQATTNMLGSLKTWERA